MVYQGRLFDVVAADYGQINHRLAFYVDRVLEGTKPGDLPIEQPSVFRLSINLKTAQSLVSNRRRASWRWQYSH